MHHKKNVHKDGIVYCRDYLNGTCLYNKDECEFMHAEKEKTQVQFTCKQCGNDFSTFEVFSEHIALHEKSEQFNCKQCENKFENKNDLEKHEQTHSEIRCKKCGETFATSEECEHHNKVHLKFIPCKNISNCQFMDRCYFSHEPTGDNEYPCFECGEKFQEIQSLMHHRKTKHDIQLCKKFLENRCKYSEKGCWFKHTSNEGGAQDFHMESLKAKPPIQTHMNQNQVMMTLLETTEQMKQILAKAQ